MSIDSSGEAVLASPEHNAAAMRFDRSMAVNHGDASANVVRSINASTAKDT
jgi:hypothetical protein